MPVLPQSTGDTTQRVEIQRDSQGRISRVTGPDAQGETVSTVYRYDAQGRLALVRNLNSNDLGTPLAYDSQGKLFTDTITAKLGAAVNWLGDSSANQWIGELSPNMSPPPWLSMSANRNWLQPCIPPVRKARLFMRWKPNYRQTQP